MDKITQTELEAAAFRKLVHHLQSHTEVQNIDLMILADFCRNCLAKWMVSEAKDKNIDMDYEQAREYIYGMPYSEWKDKFQAKATAEQLAAFEKKTLTKNSIIKEIFTDANMFTGVLGEHYKTIELICPLAAKMSHLVGDTVREYTETHDQALNIVEIGGGTGITTLAILLAAHKSVINSIDNAEIMQTQAKKSLHSWIDEGRVNFIQNDALNALKEMEDHSVDIVASAYTLHNFEQPYRELLINETFRILKKDGKFINGDRYGLDDISTHTAMIQKEIAHYFKVLTAEKKPELLEHWISHLFSDEAKNRVMRETVSIEQLKKAGFVEVKLSQRTEVNALVTAIKN